MAPLCISCFDRDDNVRCKGVANACTQYGSWYACLKMYCILFRASMDLFYFSNNLCLVAITEEIWEVHENTYTQTHIEHTYRHIYTYIQNNFGYICIINNSG